jgi:hypothetical protein
MHRSIEILVGRLITDGDFRHFLLGDPQTTLVLADEWGLQLTDREVCAIVATDPSIWDRVASELDQRLQKARVCCE